jgi:uncharacterized protein
LVKRLLLMAMAALLLSIGAACSGPEEDGDAAYYRHDYATALRIFKPRAAQGSAAAQFRLGLMYANGQGVTQDYAEALKWYQLAAKQKHTDAELSLGTLYFKGQGVAQDYAEAMKWYRFAADRGNAEANFFLSEMYANGQGVKQDYAEAVWPLREAAQRQYPKAQFKLGMIYANGQGIQADLMRAYMWLSFGAAAGDAEAIKNRDAIAKQMTPQQIAEAQKRVRECPDRKFSRGCD